MTRGGTTGHPTKSDDFAGTPGGSGPRRALRTTVRACLVAALLSLCILGAAGQPRAGLALAAGLLIGSVNGHWALWTLGSELSFRAASVGRMAVLSAAGVGAGFLIGTDVVWLAALGLAGAQAALAGAGIREMVAAPR